MQSKSDNMPSKGNSSSRGRGNFRGRGRGNDNRNYQLRFCKTEVSRKSDEIESIYQSKSESPLIADRGDEEGVCYFLRSRLPTAQGTVNGKKVIALRDTGCTGCVVRRGLVSSDQLLGKESDVTLIDESTQRYPLAMVEIDHFSQENLRHYVWMIHYMTLLLKILMGQTSGYVPFFSCGSY